MIYFVDDVGPSPLAQNVAFRDLPLRDVGQHPLLLIFSGLTPFVLETPTELILSLVIVDSGLICF